MTGALTAVAMSGGLDSSVAAALLAESGERVVGLSMLLVDRSSVSRNGRCCGSLDLSDARRVAQFLGIPHYTLRLDRDFERDVVAPFVADYVAGRTPSPCVRCNTFIKFDLMLERARALGAERLATGHYARIVEGSDGPELHSARDEAKDQSYFLFELEAQRLRAVRFPLGDMTKPQVRAEARRRGLVVAEKGESMEICFVEDGIQAFLEERLRSEGADAVGASELVDSDGRSLGRGAPYYRYTVGQRRGVGVAAASPLYVLAIQPTANRVVVGERDRLRARGLRGERLHWIGAPPTGEIEATVKIRSRHPGAAGRVRALPGGGAEVEFASPQEGVAPGQAAVFYDGTRVLGGCWITEGRP